MDLGSFLRVPDRDEVEGLVAFGQIEQTLHLRIDEGTYGDCAQLQGDRLKQDTLADVARLEMDVPLRSVSILRLGPIVKDTFAGHEIQLDWIEGPS